jgi:hypothetical protein
MYSIPTEQVKCTEKQCNSTISLKRLRLIRQSLLAHQIQLALFYGNNQNKAKGKLAPMQ